MINCSTCSKFDGQKCEHFGRLSSMHFCPYGEERKPRNNYERLKTLNLEQMADFLHDFVMNENTSLVWIEEWLKEVEE